MSIRSERGAWDEALQSGLRDWGYLEGKNIATIYRWADGRFDRFPALAAEGGQGHQMTASSEPLAVSSEEDRRALDG